MESHFPCHVPVLVLWDGAGPLIDAHMDVTTGAAEWQVVDTKVSEADVPGMQVYHRAELLHGLPGDQEGDVCFDNAGPEKEQCVLDSNRNDVGHGAPEDHVIAELVPLIFLLSLDSEP